MRFRATLFCFVLLCVSSSFVSADTAAFDLAGPPVEVKITRNGKSLPIAEVPNLQSGDRLWIHPNLPDSQSVHYLMIAAFLRGPTNPPPDNWFFRAETWKKPFREGRHGGHCSAGCATSAFVSCAGNRRRLRYFALRRAGQTWRIRRASQDLDQADSIVRGWMPTLRACGRLRNDPKALHDRSVLLARSLNIKIDQQCFDRPSRTTSPHA